MRSVLEGRRPTRWALAVVVAIVVTVAPGCGKPTDKAREELTAALDRTARRPRTILFSERGFRSYESTVRAVVEDDFRFKAGWAVDGQPVAEQVAKDDAYALRLLDPDKVAHLIDASRVVPGAEGGAAVGFTPGAAGVAAGTTALPATGTTSAGSSAATKALAALQPLLARRWVVDASGAPDVHVHARPRPQGQDAVLDALEVLDYVRQVMASTAVWKFDRDSLGYRPNQDPFPTPKERSGVDRYDLLRNWLPIADERTESGNRNLPEEQHFRKVSVYVKDGVVIAVREEIAFTDLADDVVERFDLEEPDKGNRTARDAALLDQLNALRQRQGQKPVRFRTMSVEFGFDVKPGIEVPGDAVAVDLSFLRNRGRDELPEQAADTATAATPGVTGS